MSTTRSGRVLASVVSLVCLAALAALFWDARPRSADQDPAPAVAVAPTTPAPAAADSPPPAPSPTSTAVAPPTPAMEALPSAAPTPTPEPIPTATAAPTPELREEPEPTPTPTAVDDPDLDALRVVGGPAEALLPSAQQDQIDNPLHNRFWPIFKPAPATEPDWEWSNKAELWDAIVEDVWRDAKERYGDQLYDRPGTIWPGSETSPYAVTGWSSHAESGGYGYIGLASVGLHPAESGQRRPDIGLYTIQIEVTPVDDQVFAGRLHRIADPFRMSGEMVYPDETRPYISNDAPPADPPFELIQPGGLEER